MRITREGGIKEEEEEEEMASLRREEQRWLREDRRWLREEHRWLREEQRWLRQEAWWKAEREALHNEILDLKRRLTEREEFGILGDCNALDSVTNGVPGAVKASIQEQLDISLKMGGLNVNEVPCNEVPSTVGTTVEEPVINSRVVEDLDVIEVPCNGLPRKVEMTVEEKLDWKMEDLNVIEVPCNGVPNTVETTAEEPVNDSGKMEELNEIEVPCSGVPMAVETKKEEAIYEREKKDDSIVGEVHGRATFDNQIVEEDLEVRSEAVTEKGGVEEVGIRCAATNLKANGWRVGCRLRVRISGFKNRLGTTRSDKLNQGVPPKGEEAFVRAYAELIEKEMAEEERERNAVVGLNKEEARCTDMEPQDNGPRPIVSHIPFSSSSPSQLYENSVGMAAETQCVETGVNGEDDIQLDESAVKILRRTVRFCKIMKPEIRGLSWDDPQLLEKLAERMKGLIRNGEYQIEVPSC